MITYSGCNKGCALLASIRTWLHCTGAAAAAVSQRKLHR